MRQITAYQDAKGKLHQNPRAATIVDLAAIFGQSAEGMATGIATTILEQREAIERILAEHDAVENDHAPTN